MSLFKRLLPLLGLILLLYLLKHMDLERVQKELQLFSWPVLLFAILSNWAGLLIKSCRFAFVFLGKLHGEMHRVFFASMYYGLLTPGRVGELSKILFLKELGMDEARSLKLIVWERCFDLLVLLLIGGGVLIATLNQKDLLFLYLGLVTLLCFLHHRYQGFAGAKGFWLLHLGSTLLSYGVYGLGFCLLLGPDNIWIAIQFLLSVFAANLLSLLPISFQGLGAKEPAYLLLLHFMPQEKILAASLVHFMTTLLSNLSISAIFAFKRTKNCKLFEFV